MPFHSLKKIGKIHLAELLLECLCGKLKGRLKRISRSRNRRVVCLCRDCQSFAHFLGEPGRVLDGNGGTDITLAYPADVEITDGADQIACVQLSRDGIFRWYARCCRTPIGNTATTAKIPYVGLIRMIYADKTHLDEFLGRPLCRMNGAQGIAPLPRDTSLGTPVRVKWRAMQFVSIGFLLRNAQPSPFFDGAGKPVRPVDRRPDSEYEGLIPRS